MNLLNKHSLIIIGVVFHLIYLWSIFDIYFVSPLVHGMTPYPSTPTPPAKRLFLIVGDGLRADTAFANVTYPQSGAYPGKTGYLAPNLRNLVLNNATFGISHTRMPTESRPGHIAMIGGFYEDVSAVTKGWKSNPVDFDFTFNQSSHSFAFGSPDVVPIFTHGLKDENKIDIWVYGSEFEDFTKSSIELDKYVFDKLDELFLNATTDPELDALLRQEKTCFFLHLLGCDTAGHSYRPFSDEYFNNAAYIDSQLPILQQKIKDFYEDDDSAFVFTSDHGMSEFGSHGDGHPDNTRTPLVVWGAGVPKPILATAEDKGDHNEYSDPWLLNVKRHDVNQADITPLMSYLVGLQYPVNSVGELPLDFIDADIKIKANSLLNNALQIVEQYNVKETQMRGSQLWFKQFLPFKTAPISSQISNIQEIIESGDYDLAIEKSEILMKQSLEGLRYLQTYNWVFLRTIVTLGFLGWIGFALTSFLYNFVISEEIKANDHQTNFKAQSISVFSLLAGYLFLTKSPVIYYLYVIFPVFFWCIIIEHRFTTFQGLTDLVLRVPGTHPAIQGVSTILVIIIALEAIVYGYFQRKVFTVILLILSAWPMLEDRVSAENNENLVYAWVFVTVCSSSFTLLPVVKVENLQQILFSGGGMLVIGIYGVYNLFTKYPTKITTKIKNGLTGQLVLVLTTSYATQISVSALQAREDLPLFSQVLGWISLVLSFVLPFLQGPIISPEHLLLVEFLAFAPTYIILTISYEGFFYIGFSLILFIWIELETIFFPHDKTRKTQQLSLREVRIALITFFLAQFGFFGTGNIASISSFQLESVRRLIPIFDPFAMAVLLLTKILIPFALLSTALGILNIKLNLEPSALFSLVVCISDILALNFFYLVKDEGSWLDIGTTISHYCISCLMSLFIVGLEYLSGFMTRGVVRQEAKDIEEEKKKA